MPVKPAPPTKSRMSRRLTPAISFTPTRPASAPEIAIAIII
jgi:hypothetical protein